MGRLNLHGVLMSQCKHWSDCGVRGGGCCSQNLYGGKPSGGVCQRCESYSGPARGLGDRINTFTELTGIKSMVKAVTDALGLPCGCADRRDALNGKFPNAQH